MKVLVFFFALLLFFAFNAKTQTVTDTAKVYDEYGRAAFMADSTAKAELKKYQKKYPGRLTRGQLTLVAYNREMSTPIKGQNGYYLFDYDYNRPLGGLMYLLHFSVVVNVHTKKTIFETTE